MTRTARLVLFAVGALGVAVLLVSAFGDLPRFGTDHHPYGDRAVTTSLHQQTANAVGSVTFDQRGIDTLGEEFILFAAALGALVLLRPERGEQRGEPLDEDEEEGTDAPTETSGRRVGPPLDAVQLFGYLGLPVTMLLGWYVIAHGHLSPGGGFQGGVVLATAIHLLYLARSYRALERLRPVELFEVTEALGAGAYAALGFATLAGAGAFLANSLPHGQLGELLSAGTVPLLNVAVGVEVASAIVLLLAEFLEQALVLRAQPEPR